MTDVVKVVVWDLDGTLWPGVASAQAPDDGDHNSVVIRIHSDGIVAANESVETLVVLNSDAVIDGTVNGSLLVVRGDATISGRIAWSENPRDHHRDVGTDLKADRIDFLQVKALADLLVGRNLNEITSLADSFSILIKTDLFQLDDIRLKDVSVDVGYADDRLTVTRIDVGDLGGASFRATSGSDHPCVRADTSTTKKTTLKSSVAFGTPSISG